MQIAVGVWIHNKSGTKYLVTGTRLDCTNNKPEADATMVEYQNHDGKKFTRTLREFLTKFTIECSL